MTAMRAGVDVADVQFKKDTLLEIQRGQGQWPEASCAHVRAMFRLRR